MLKILIISEVALLSEEIEDSAKYNMQFVHRAGPAAPGGSLLLSRMQSQLRFDTNASSTPSVDDSEKESNDKSTRNFSSTDNTPSPSSPETSQYPKGRKWVNAFKKGTSGKKQRNGRSNTIDSTTMAEIEKMLEWEEPQTNQGLSVSYFWDSFHSHLPLLFLIFLPFDSSGMIIRSEPSFNSKKL
jgi:hypothetical protein